MARLVAGQTGTLQCSTAASCSVKPVPVLVMLCFALLPVSAWRHSTERSLVTLMPEADGLVTRACHHLIVLNPSREVQGTRFPACEARVTDEGMST